MGWTSVKLKPGSLPVFTWKSLAAYIPWAKWTLNTAKISAILVFLQHSVDILQTEALWSSFELSKHLSLHLHVFNTKNVTSLNPYKCRFLRSVSWDFLMHETQTLILKTLPQLKSTPLLQTPLLAGRIASLVTMLRSLWIVSSPIPKALPSLYNPAPLTLVKDLTSKLLFLRWNRQDTTPFACLSWTQICKALWTSTLYHHCKFNWSVFELRGIKKPVKMFSDATQVSLCDCNFFYIISQYFYYKLRRHHYSQYQWNYQNKVWSTAVFPQLLENRRKLLLSRIASPWV